MSVLDEIEAKWLLVPWQFFLSDAMSALISKHKVRYLQINFHQIFPFDVLYIVKNLVKNYKNPVSLFEVELHRSQELKSQIQLHWFHYLTHLHITIIFTYLSVTSFNSGIVFICTFFFFFFYWMRVNNK